MLVFDSLIGGMFLVSQIAFPRLGPVAAATWVSAVFGQARKIKSFGR